MSNMLTKYQVLAGLCLAGLLIPLISRGLAETEGPLAWLIDLAGHWQWVFLGGLLLFTAISAWREKRMMFLLLAVPLPWFTASEPARSTRADAPFLKVAAANVGMANKEPGPLLDWLHTQRIDVVALSEVSPAYAQALKSKSGFAHAYLVPRSGPFGLALLSRHPLIEAEGLQDSDGIPRVRATLLWREEALTVTVIHPMPPISSHYHSTRNDRLRTAAKESGATTRPGLLLGDFNATPWSSGMLGPTEAGYRRATGLSPTWPAALGGIVGIPIDQILVTGHWGVNGAGTGPILDSDHIPVWASVSLHSGGGTD